jgi:hypothetical protein
MVARPVNWICTDAGVFLRLIILFRQLLKSTRHIADNHHWYTLAQKGGCKMVYLLCTVAILWLVLGVCAVAACVAAGRADERGQKLAAESDFALPKAS